VQPACLALACAMAGWSYNKAVSLWPWPAIQILWESTIHINLFCLSNLLNFFLFLVMGISRGDALTLSFSFNKIYIELRNGAALII